MYNLYLIEILWNFEWFFEKCFLGSHVVENCLICTKILNFFTEHPTYSQKKNQFEPASSPVLKRYNHAQHYTIPQYSWRALRFYAE